MNKQNIILNIFLTLVLVLVWGGILFVSFLLWLISDVFRLLGNGALMYIFAIIYALVFVLPILFRKRIKKYLSLPLAFFVFTLISVILVSIIFVGAKSHISEFSGQKWMDYKRLRIHMIDNLEEEYEIIGKSNKEIIDLLGEPEYLYNTERIVYEYYVGSGIIDPYGYQIEFENNIAINTILVEH